MIFPAAPPFEVLTIAKQNGTFAASGVCTTGGDRLFVVGGATKVTAVKPNPFVGGTTIEYETSRAGHVELRVMDVRGAEVGMLVSEDQGIGLHSAYFDASQLASGLYFCELRQGGTIDRVPVILVQ